VLVAEVLALVPAEARIVLDCTIGGGGHAEAILRHLGNEVELIGFDRDSGVLATVRERLSGFPNRVVLHHDSYANLPQYLGDKFANRIDFVLLDLGLSSLQLEHSGRGFSYQASADPLDLRFDETTSEPLASRLAVSSAEELATVLRDFGEIRRARLLAREIMAGVENGSMVTVKDLAETASRHLRGERRSQFLAQVWQALRIWVNDELGQLRFGLQRVIDYLRPGGVLAAISFHSLEDRIVKDFIYAREHPCTCPKGLPQCICGQMPSLERITKKPIRPTMAETEANPRARSARLRAARKPVLT
jgi:16S rRNA (cytosine1402-N4)-methyltransferase